jgi:DamX protein
MSHSGAVSASNTASNLAAAYGAYMRQLAQQEEDHQSINLMSFEYQAKARGRQLDTLLHLSHFSDYLVLVTAATGAGKSTFIDQFLRVQPADACIVHLALNETVSAAWVIRQLVQQLPVQLPNHASLEVSILAIQELAQELTRDEQVLLLVVDDAHWLDDDALELLANLLPRSAKVDSRPHVILCADQSLVERIEAPQFTEMRQERFYHLVLAPFSQEESADYLRQRLQIMGIAQGQGLAPIQLLQLHQLAQGNPGYLNMLANKALHKGGFVQQTGLPIMHIAATIMVVCLLAGIWVFNYVTDSTRPPIDLPQVATVIEVVEADVEAADDLLSEPIAQALPPLEPIELSTPSANVSLQPELQPEPKLEPESMLEPAVVVAVPEPAATATPVLPAWPQATAISQHAYGYAALMKVSPEHFSLQVLGARLEPTLEAFLTRHKLEQPYYVLQLERGNAPWYILLVGDYQNSGAARDAIKALPLALRNQQPWPRQVLKIQQQIRDKFNTSVE